MKLWILWVLCLVLVQRVVNQKVVCYYPNWAYYRKDDARILVEEIDPFRCTHLVYAYAVLNSSSYLIQPYDSWLDLHLANYNRFTGLKFQNPSLKILLALGAFNDAQSRAFSHLVSDSARISEFTIHVKDFLRIYDFDGLDIGWENPSSDSDKTGLINLLKSLSDSFRSGGFVLSLSAGPTSGSQIDLRQLSDSVDFVNLMAYDYHGPWESSADHHAPLYPKISDPSDTSSVDSTINFWIENNFPREKIILGIPAYGRTWKINNPAGFDPPAAAEDAGNPGPYTGIAGFLAFHEICTMLDDTWTIKKDPEQRRGPFAYKDCQWISFDDVEMVETKSEYILDKGLGGAAIWEITLDDFNDKCGLGSNPTLTAVSKKLLKTSGSSKTTTEAPVTEVTCDFDGQFIADPDSCSSYYFCSWNIPQKFFCPPGTVFNIQLYVCDWSENVQC